MNSNGADINSVAGVQLAVVADNNDPEKMGRVKVNFPWDGSTTWALVAQPLAGNQYGSFFMPEVGDQVLVAFQNNNHNQPVILGSIYNGTDKPKAELCDSNNYHKAIITKGGNTVILYDEPGQLTISLSNGDPKDSSSNLIVLSNDNKHITIQSPNGKISLVAETIEIQSTGDTSIKSKNITMEASGALKGKSAMGMELKSDDTITAAGTTGVKISASAGDVNLEGMNIAATGQIGATVKGNATAELSASGQTTVKGAIVMIN